MEYDLFICHASEDKAGLVRRLADALRNLEVRVWYDEFSLRPGDSLSQSIDRGLASSRFGLVVLSPAFFSKRWPQHELRGLTAMELADASKIIPVWHGVSHSDVLGFSPPLADKIAIRTEDVDATTLALQVLQRVRPDLYLDQPRLALEQVAGEDIVDALQDEIDRTSEELERTRAELSEFQCPVCRRPLLNSACVEVEYGDYRVDTYECGYTAEDGRMSVPCPSDPDYPTSADFNFTVSPQSGGGFVCVASGKTEMARRIGLWPTSGDTEEEAEKEMRIQLAFRQRKSPSAEGDQYK